MKLEWNSYKGVFVLRVPRDPRNPLMVKNIMDDHGFDFSVPDSTPQEAVMFTREPYAAAAFFEYATPDAAHQLVVITTQIEASRRPESKGHIKCPDDEELAPFQIAGVEYALARQNTLFGDVPGLGKTPEAICFANEIGAKRVLVICPANIRLQWAKAIRRWTTMGWPYDVYPILHGKHGVHPTAAWNIVSYDLAHTPTVGKALARGRYDLLILDEAHYLKTIDTRRTRAIFGGGEDRVFEAIAARAGAVVALTGTPLPNRPREAYTLARGLCFDAIDWMSEDSFRQRFNPSRRVELPDGRMAVDERSGRHSELQARLRGNFMVRREKYGPEGVGKQLGLLHLPSFDIVHVTPDAAVKRALAAESLLGIDPEDLEGADIATIGAIATVRRQMGVAMAPLVAEYVDMLLEGGEEKLLVFAHHIEVLDILQRKLERWGCCRIDGRVGAQAKQRLVDGWVKDKDMQVMIGNMQSMGTGTDGLQAVAHHALFAEPDWVMGVNQQAVDRIDRAGQDVQVQADFLVAPGSFGEKVLASALRKGQTVHKALDARVGDNPLFLEEW